MSLPRFHDGRLLRADELNEVVSAIQRLDGALAGVARRLDELAPTPVQSDLVVSPSTILLLSGAGGPDKEQPTWTLQVLRKTTDGRTEPLPGCELSLDGAAEEMAWQVDALALKPKRAGTLEVTVHCGKQQLRRSVEVRPLNLDMWQLIAVDQAAHNAVLMHSIRNRRWFKELPSVRAEPGPRTLRSHLLPIASQGEASQLIVLFHCLDRPVPTAMTVYDEDGHALCEESLVVLPSERGDKFQEVLLVWTGQAARVEINGATPLAVGHPSVREEV